MKIRSAAAVASAGLIALAAPAMAAAAPLTGSLGAGSSSSGEQDPADGPILGDDSVGCTLDWTTVSNHTFNEDDVTDVGPEYFVSEELGASGYSALNHWGSQDTMHWRSVVATDRAIDDFALTVTLPAGFDYAKSDVSVSDANDEWFFDSWYKAYHKDVDSNPWPNGQGPDDLDISDPVVHTDGTTTFTVTADDDGTLPAESHFVIIYTGTDGSDVADTISATQHVTGTAVANPGDLPFCSTDIGGVISGSLGSLGSLSAS